MSLLERDLMLILMKKITTNNATVNGSPKLSFYKKNPSA